MGYQDTDGSDWLTSPNNDDNHWFFSLSAARAVSLEKNLPESLSANCCSHLRSHTSENIGYVRRKI